MERVKNPHGFTLVEVVLALAITALLIAGAITAGGGLRQETSFNTAIDEIHNRVLRIQNEAFSGVKAGLTSDGKSDTAVFGKLVEFDPANKNQMISYTLIGNAQDADATLQACDSEVINFPSQLEYQGASKQAIIFTRETGSVFVAPSSYNFTPTAVCNAPPFATVPINNGNPFPVPPPPNPCLSPVIPAVVRDCQRIADLTTIHTQLENYAALYGGKLPTTAAYGGADPGGWDYSSQSGFLPFLPPPPPPLDPLNNGTGDVFFGGSGYAYAYFCYPGPSGWPAAQWNSLALGAKLERPGDYPTDPHMIGGIYWYTPGIYQTGMFTCVNSVPAAPVQVTVSPSSRAFPSWHLLNTGGAPYFQTYTVTNPSGTTPINLGTTPVSGDTASFPVIGNSCAGTTLAPGASCFITVKFYPPSGDGPNYFGNSGVRNISITINNTDGVPSPPTVTASGRAVSDRMGPGDRMLRGDYLKAYSPACYRDADTCSSTFTLDTNGNLALYSGPTLVWCVCTGAGAFVQVQGDGNFVLYDAASNPLYATMTNDGQLNWLMIYDDGTLDIHPPSINPPNYGFKFRIWP